MRSFASTVILLSLALAGCRDGGGGGDNPDARRDSGGEGGMTIQEIQTPPGPGVGSPVELHGVIVTAVDRFGQRQGAQFYVQEPGGGPYSGVLVFTTSPAVAELQPGDVVSITGAVVDEFALDTDTTGRKLTELTDATGGMMSIVETGTAEVPQAQVVDPRMLAASDDEAEKWEGVLVRFDNVSVVRAPQGVSDSDATLKEMTVSGPFRVGSSLAALDGIERDDCYASITGIGDYFFEYKILPRSAADIVTGSSCPAQEAGAGMCANTTDDDADGFADCEDFSCQETVPACTMAVEITAIQMGTIPVNTRVRLENVTVTGVKDTEEDKVVWVQDGAGAPHNGIAVYFGTTPIPSGLLLGDDVTLEGAVAEFFDRTEIDIALDGSSNPIFTKNGVGTPLAPVEVPLATLASPASAEPYEGVLVALSDVAVVSPNPDAPDDDFGEWTVGTTSNAVRVGSDMRDRPTPLAMGDCYGTVAGVFDFTFGNYKIEPRQASDLVTAASGCPAP